MVTCVPYLLPVVGRGVVAGDRSARPREDRRGHLSVSRDRGPLPPPRPPTPWRLAEEEPTEPVLEQRTVGTTPADLEPPAPTTGGRPGTERKDWGLSTWTSSPIGRCSTEVRPVATAAL
jgi:hypothetical protein